MSEWKPEVVRIGEIRPHPNKGNPDPTLCCDTLSLTEVMGGYPVLFRTGEFAEGDLAAYIPVETLVPTSNPIFSFLGEHRRIRAKRMRGVFSMGMLVAAPEGLDEGDSVVDSLGLEKYTPLEEGSRMSGGPVEKGPDGWDFPKYTDIEGLRTKKNVLQFGEPVVITEKIHGTNARFCHDGTRLWVGSRETIKKEPEDPSFATNWWWNLSSAARLAVKLAKQPLVIFFGEIYGKSVQDMTYSSDTLKFRVFDTYSVAEGRYNDWEKTRALADSVGLETVPVLYKGPWEGYDAHLPLSEGSSTLADHIREGYVVKPLTERYVHRIGRVIFKMIGESYLLRTEAKKKKKK